jgi:putative phage-type endonuclease
VVEKKRVAEKNGDSQVPETKPEALDYETWRRNRGTYCGGSDVAAIMGLSPYRNIGEVWLEKVRAQEKLELGDESIDPEMQNRFTRWGTRLEKVIIAEYAEVTGFKVTAPGMQLVRHPEFPFIGGTVDAEAETPFEDRIIVEGKCTDAFYQSRERVWGQAGTDEVPEWFVPQGMQYLIVKQLETRCDFAVLIGGNDFRLYHVQYDRELAEQMIELQIWFWGLVTRREAPPMDFSAKNATKLQKRIYDKIVGETLVITDPAQQQRMLRLIAMRDYASEQGKKWIGDKGDGGVKGACTAELLAMAGNAGRMEVPVEVGGKMKTVALNRKMQIGYDVPARWQDPIVKTTFEPYSADARRKIFDALREEKGEDYAKEEKPEALGEDGQRQIEEGRR